MFTTKKFVVNIALICKNHNNKNIFKRIGMPRLKDAFLTHPDTGPCDIDVEKAVKAFTVKTFISKYDGEYTLVKTTHKRNVVLKARISSEHAEALIERLALVESKDPVFAKASTFRHPDFRISMNNYTRKKPGE